MTTTTSPLTSFLQSTSPLHRGAFVSFLAVLLTAVLDLTSLSHVRKMRSTPAGNALYKSAILTNVLNNLVLGPITYYVTIEHVCQPPGSLLSFWEQGRAILILLVVQGVLYYYCHKAFHEVKGLYWIHRYHHRFNTVVVPSSANAVSVAEYTIAYMLPLMIGARLGGADEVYRHFSGHQLSESRIC